MSRYIDADALRDKLYEADAVTMRGVAIINNEPTVDAVQVVRCKKCRHGTTAHGISDGWVLCTKPYTVGAMMHPNDWFCADGKRRTE